MKHALVFPYVWRKVGDMETAGRETVRHMLSRQPTFQLSDRVSHELKVICRLIDGGGLRLDGVNTEYHSYKSRQNSPPSLLWFPLGFWGRQANFVATCSTEIQSERRPHRQTDDLEWGGGDVPTSLHSWPRGGVRILLGRRCKFPLRFGTSHTR